jgi:hypothetical protein
MKGGLFNPERNKSTDIINPSKKKNHQEILQQDQLLHKINDMKKKQKNVMNNFIDYINQYGLKKISDKKNKKHKKMYNGDTLNYDDIDFDINDDVPIENYESPKILSESEYLEKIILSKFANNFSTDNFFTKNKNKIFTVLLEKLHEKEEARRNRSSKSSKSKSNMSSINSRKSNKQQIKGGSLTTYGNDLLKLLHLFDAKHDFSKHSNYISDYIKDKFDVTIQPIAASLTYQQNKDLTSLFELTDDYEEQVLNHVISNNTKLLSDSTDDNANIMYIDIELNDNPQHYIYFDNLNPLNKNQTFNIAYDSIADIIKNFYNFSDAKIDKTGYLFDTQVRTYDKLDIFVKHLRTTVLNKFSKQLFPFENAYDPHSSTLIEFPTLEDDAKFKAITNYNFNVATANEHLSAIRDKTREFLNFNHADLLTCPLKKVLNVKLMKLTIAKTAEISALLTANTNATLTTYANFIFGTIYTTFSTHGIDDKHTLPCSYHSDIIFYKTGDNVINVFYYKSFNTVPLLKECIDSILRANTTNIRLFINDIFKTSLITDLANDSSKWLLYFIVLYLIFTNNYSNQTEINATRTIIVDILLDLKKSGDWAQSLFCSKYNLDTQNKQNDKECYFVSGDKLSAARSILNGNVKTITATDYDNLISKKTQKKKCILTLFNGTRKLTFSDLKTLIEKSIFHSEAFKFNNFNIDDVINKLKKNSGDTLDTLIDDDNINFEYFWHFIIIIIYQMRIYYNCYSVFQIKPLYKPKTKALINPINCETIPFNDSRRFKIDEGILSDPTSRKYRNTANPGEYQRIFDITNEYQLCQFNRNIFVEYFNISNDLENYFKLIDKDIVHNNDLDEKYLNDVITLFNTVYGTIVINYYKKDATNNLYNYLKNIFNTHHLIINKSSSAINFLRKICNLNKLCQILYIDNFTKSFSNINDLYRAIELREHIVSKETEKIKNITDLNDLNEELKAIAAKIEKKEISKTKGTITEAKLNKINEEIAVLTIEYNEVNTDIQALTTNIDTLINTIKVDIQTHASPTVVVKYTDPPKTILKDIIDNFYDNVCVLIHTIQGNMINIGDETRIPVLKTLIKSADLLNDNIAIFKELLQKIETVKSTIDILYSSHPNKDTIKNNIIMQISKNKYVSESINLLDKGVLYDINVEILFDRYLDIYNQTVEVFPELDIQKMPNSTTICANLPILIEEFKKLKDIDINSFINLIKTTITKEFDGTNPATENIINLIRIHIAKNIEMKAVAAAAAAAPAVPLSAPAVALKSKKGPAAKKVNVKSAKPVKEYKTISDVIIIACQNAFVKIIEIANNYNNVLYVNSLSKDDHVENAKKLIFNLNDVLKYLYEISSVQFKKTSNYSKSSITESIIGYIENINTYFIRSISSDLYDYFNSIILQYYPLIESKKLSIGTEAQRENVKKAMDDLLKTDKLQTEFFKYSKYDDNKQLRLTQFHDSMKTIYDQIKTNLYIIKTNIHYIYKLKEDGSSEKFVLDIPAKFTSKEFLFFENVKLLEGTKRAKVEEPLEAMDEDSNATDKVIADYMWYEDQKTFDALYDIMIYQNKQFNSTNAPKSDVYKNSKLSFLRNMEKPIVGDGVKNQRLDTYFEDLAFIMNLKDVLKKFIKESYENLYNISTFIDVNKSLTINTILHKTIKVVEGKDVKFKANVFDHYYNINKYKIIAIVGKYINKMIVNKLSNLLTLQKSNKLYNFDNIFKTELFPNPNKQINTITSIFDIITNVTKINKKYTNNGLSNLKPEEFRHTFNKYEAQKNELVELSRNSEDIQNLFKRINTEYNSAKTINIIKKFIDGEMPPSNEENE